MSSPEIPGRYRAYLAWAAGLVAAVAVCAWQGGIEFERFRGRDLGAIRDTLAGLARPDLSAAFLGRIAGLVVDSVCIGLVGTALALVLGIALALPAARWPGLVHAHGAGAWSWAAREPARLGTRAVLAVLRTVPEIVWAYLFVRIFGLGPSAAVLAIALSCAGIVGKLYAELIEAVAPGPARGLRAAGAGHVAVLCYGVLPLVRGQWVGYALFRLECAIRSGAILGVVGAGGLGQEIELGLRYYQLDKLATALLALIALIVALEAASRLLRRLPGRWLTLLLAVGASIALIRLDIPWRDLLDSHAVEQIQRFAAGFARPTADLGFWLDALGQTWRTVAMALCATAAAALLAFLLAPLATWQLTVGHYLPTPPGRRTAATAAGLASLALSRGILQITRALPDLVWALLFVLWIGPGATAGALAILAHTTGNLGRLYSDILEEADPGPLRMLEATGASRLAVLIHGALPQVGPRLLAHTLYCFEVNIRATAMVGFVGAGGLGDALHTALSLFHMRDLAALLIVLLATVMLVDAIGDRVRWRLLRAGGR